MIAVPSEAVIAQPPGWNRPAGRRNNGAAEDSVSFYGFTMLDSGYDFGQINPNWYDVVRPTQLPSFKNNLRRVEMSMPACGKPASA